MERVAREDVHSTEAVDRVHLSKLAAGERMSVQGFEIAPGAVVPEHRHEHEQVGVVVEGELTFLVGGEEVVCGSGDSFALPSDEPHAAENRGETAVVGYDVFSPPRLDPDWAE